MTAFTDDDVRRAWSEWGCNCGPAAIAAVCGLTLDQVRPHMGDFERRGYTNPTLMWSSLRSLGVKFSYRAGAPNCGWPAYGLARIQWTGPWTRPGALARAAYRHTHWIGVHVVASNNIGIFDINAIGNGTGWCEVADWEEAIVPLILHECVPKADGGWYITHAVEIDRG